MTEKKIAQRLIDKNKEYERVKDELEVLKSAYAGIICPFKIGDIVESESLAFDNAQIRIGLIRIENIVDNKIYFVCKGVARKLNGEFGNRTLSTRVELKI